MKKALSKKLSAITSSFQKLEQAAKTLDRARQSVRALVDDYEKARLALFAKMLEERCLGWCGLCDSVFRNRDLAPLFTEAYELSSENYRAGPFAHELYFACPSCAKDPRGKRPVGTESDDAHVYGVEREYLKVEKRPDGYWVAALEQWEMLPGVDPSLVYPDETQDILSPVPLDLDELHRGRTERMKLYMRQCPTKWFPLPDGTRMRLLPDIVSAKCGESLVGMPPRVEFVPQGATSSMDARLAPYIGISPKDRLIIDDDE